MTPGSNQATLLIERHRNGAISRWYEYEGNVFSNYRWSRPEPDLTTDRHIQEALASPLSYTEDIRKRRFLEVDGILYWYVHSLDRLRFGAGYDPDLGEGFASLNVVPRTSATTELFYSFEEARIALSGFLNKDDLLAEFKYVHPKLMGDPLPDFKVGDRVTIAVKDKEDPKRRLNGQIGEIVFALNAVAHVALQGKRPILEEFRKSDLAPVVD